MKRRIAGLTLAALMVPSLAVADPVQVERPVHRLAYAGAGAFLVGGVGMSLLARQSAQRADGISDARSYQQEVARARGAAASASALYALAGLTLAYAVALELLPKGSAERAGLTFHF